MQFFKGGKFIPIGRVGQDEDVGPLAVFLASAASNHINGELVIIDGGGLAGGITPTGVAPAMPSSGFAGITRNGRNGTSRRTQRFLARRARRR